MTLANDLDKPGLDTAADGAGRSHWRRMVVNAMTVDVEDYFQVSAFVGHINRAEWDSRPTRVARNVDLVLDLFAERGAHATFFVLGWIAERHRGLVHRIVEEGHELASHGYDHVKLHQQTPEQFRIDVRTTKRILEDMTGICVRGYRAPSFSIGAETLWAFPILAEEGYEYSSSIYPIRHDHYGMPKAPRSAFRPLDHANILECPMSTATLLSRNLPCGGGGYFRLMPYRFSRWAMRRVNQVDGQPCIFYFHPWEVDPDQPRVLGLPLKTRVRHYLNLGRMHQRLHSVLTDFTWDRMDRVFLQGTPGAAGQQ